MVLIYWTERINGLQVSPTLLTSRSLDAKVLIEELLQILAC